MADAMVPDPPGSCPVSATPVIDLEGYRITRGRTPGAPLYCQHRHLTYSASERRVTCDDCKRDIEGFDAFLALVRGFDTMILGIQARQRKVAAAEAHALVSRAAKAVDKVWAGRRLAPCCPNCSRGLLPEDFADGVDAAVSRDLEIERRKAEKKREERRRELGNAE